ncbi:MAG: dihydroxy-acid dehydratase, partial [Oscillospiraceae bacterium]
LDTSVLTVTAKTLAENLEGVKNLNPEIIRPIENPYSQNGGIAVLKGNLAPDGCVVKQSAVAPEMMLHQGPARVFDSEDDAISAINGGKIKAGDVIVIRYE